LVGGVGCFAFLDDFINNPHEWGTGVNQDALLRNIFSCCVAPEYEISLRLSASAAPLVLAAFIKPPS
jgi:hypothetical protein